MSKSLIKAFAMAAAVTSSLLVGDAQAQTVGADQTLSGLLRHLTSQIESTVPDLMRTSIHQLETACEKSAYRDICFEVQMRAQLQAKYPMPCSVGPTAKNIAKIYAGLSGRNASNAELTEGRTNIMREEDNLSRCDRAPPIRP